MQEGFEFGWEAVNGKNEARSEDGVMAGASECLALGRESSRISGCYPALLVRLSCHHEV